MPRKTLGEILGEIYRYIFLEFLHKILMGFLQYCYINTQIPQGLSPGTAFKFPPVILSVIPSGTSPRIASGISHEILSEILPGIPPGIPSVIQPTRDSILNSSGCLTSNSIFWYSTKNSSRGFSRNFSMDSPGIAPVIPQGTPS